VKLPSDLNPILDEGAPNSTGGIEEAAALCDELGEGSRWTRSPLPPELDKRMGGGLTRPRQGQSLTHGHLWCAT